MAAKKKKQTTDNVLRIAPQEGPQTLLVCCPYEEIFFGGARGGGKTFGVLIDWIIHADKYKENAFGLILRESFPALSDFLDKKAMNVLPKLGWKYEVGKKRFVHPNGAILRLGYIDDKGTEDQYQGQEYTWLCYEEITNWTEKQSEQLDKLRACLRSPAGVPIRVIATGNPGGVGHDWVKRRYIKPAPPKTPFWNPETGTTTVFIPSLFTDNKILAEADPNYLDRIVGKPHLKKAWRYGDWNISPDGNVILRDWWKWYEWDPLEVLIPQIGMGISPVPRFLGIVQSWDTGYEEKTRNDYSACVTAGYTYTDIYILNVWRGKVTFPSLVQQAKILAAKWRPTRILIEGKATGKSLRQTLRKETLLPITEVNPQGSKLERVSAASTMIETGKVWLPQQLPWVEEFYEECSSFPDGSNDDMVDALAQLINKVRYAGGALQQLAAQQTKKAPPSIYGR